MNEWMNEWMMCHRCDRTGQHETWITFLLSLTVFILTVNSSNTNVINDRAAATICLRPLQVHNIFLFIRQVALIPACWLFNTSATSWPLTFWPWNWCTSHVWRGLPLPILVFLGLSVLELGPMWQTNVRQADVRQKHHLLPPPYGGGGIISTWEPNKCFCCGVDIAGFTSIRSVVASCHSVDAESWVDSSNIFTNIPGDRVPTADNRCPCTCVVPAHRVRVAGKPTDEVRRVSDTSLNVLLQRRGRRCD